MASTPSTQTILDITYQLLRVAKGVRYTADFSKYHMQKIKDLSNQS